MRIILLHGMGGSRRDWDEVIAADPALEKAEAWELPEEDNFDNAAEALARRLAESRVPYGLAGYSLGGRLAIRAAQHLLFLKPPKRLALLGAGLGFPSREERAERAVFDNGWAELAERDRDAFWERWYEQGIFSGFHALSPEKKNTWMEARRLLSNSILRRQLVSWSPAQHDLLLGDLREIVHAKVATLYLAGENDKKYARLALDLHNEGLQTEILSGVGHVLPLEAPARVAQALAQFFKGV